MRFRKYAVSFCAFSLLSVSVRGTARSGHGRAVLAPRSGALTARTVCEIPRKEMGLVSCRGTQHTQKQTGFEQGFGLHLDLPNHLSALLKRPLPPNTSRQSSSYRKLMAKDLENEAGKNYSNTEAVSQRLSGTPRILQTGSFTSTATTNVSPHVNSCCVSRRSRVMTTTTRIQADLASVRHLCC